MCLGGINIQLCHQCVVIAAQKLSSDCQFDKEAIIWYDKCMLRYSNRSFFSTVETSPRLGLLPTYDVGNESNNLEPLQFSLATIEAATNKFSHENSLGRGGFGQVYKGILSNGQEIAVKRLSKSSGHGGEEFKNERRVAALLKGGDSDGFNLKKMKVVVLVLSLSQFMEQNHERELIGGDENGGVRLERDGKK
ncbi:hypothetical protein K1719_005604 [Acacia pycnantha]|nr:hypothetical protein K1719_005604 [Acacia pycnantha]